jgi:hypothetical protein
LKIYPIKKAFICQEIRASDREDEFRSLRVRTEEKEAVRQKPRPPLMIYTLSIGITYLTAAFSAFPAINFGTRIAGILISSPVRGFLPTRALRLEVVKVPNPTKETFWPFLSEPMTPPKKEPMALVAAALLILAESAIWAINSALVIFPSPLLTESFELISTAAYSTSHTETSLSYPSEQLDRRGSK